MDSFGFGLEKSGPSSTAPVQNRSGRSLTTVGEDGLQTTVLVGIEHHQAGQETPVWCWAACTEMILGFDGKEVSQESIAERVHGYDQHESPEKVLLASYLDLLYALCPEGPKSSLDSIWQGVERDLIADPSLIAGGGELAFDAEQALVGLFEREVPMTKPPVEDLIAGNPAVVGLRHEQYPDMGHACLLIGATYRAPKSGGLGNIRAASFGVDSALADSALDRLDGGYEIHAVMLIDPNLEDDPQTEENEMQVTMDFEEFKRRVEFVTTRAQALKILESYQGVVRVERD